MPTPECHTGVDKIASDNANLGDHVKQILNNRALDVNNLTAKHDDIVIKQPNDATDVSCSRISQPNDATCISSDMTMQPNNAAMLNSGNLTVLPRMELLMIFVIL